VPVAAGDVVVASVDRSAHSNWPFAKEIAMPLVQITLKAAPPSNCGARRG
jgi:hypothetical protein